MQETVERRSDGILEPVSETNYLSGDDFVALHEGIQRSPVSAFLNLISPQGV
jgi:hypothetical protein